MSKLIAKAREFAFEAHEGHVRKYTGAPYTDHLEAVAKHVERVGGSETMIAAAWLHDVVEDTPATVMDIGEMFGSDVAYLVMYLSDVSKPKDGNRATRKAIDRWHIAKGDSRVHTIKLADLIDNSSSITEHDPAFAAVYMKEKKSLLEVLKDGDPVLLAEATAIVDAWFEGD